MAWSFPKRTSKRKPLLQIKKRGHEDSLVATLKFAINRPKSLRGRGGVDCDRCGLQAFRGRGYGDLA